MNKIPLLQCINVCKYYREKNIRTYILNNVSFNIYCGEFISIVGNSGSGKSTFLHLLSGLDTPNEGEIFFKGRSLKKMSFREKAHFLNKEIGIIYQSHHLLMEFSALENVTIPLLISSYKLNQAKKIAKKMLNIVGLSKIINNFPSELSGGERQRVAIARALVNQPNLVIADEPTGNLDINNAKMIFKLIKNINQKQNTTFLVVTHDLQLSKQFIRQIKIYNNTLIDILKNKSL